MTTPWCLPSEGGGCEELESRVSGVFKMSKTGDVRELLRDKRVVLIGDSTQRRLMWGVCSMLNESQSKTNFDRYGAGNTIFTAQCPELLPDLRLAYFRATSVAELEGLLQRPAFQHVSKSECPWDVMALSLSWWFLRSFQDPNGDVRPYVFNSSNPNDRMNRLHGTPSMKSMTLVQYLIRDFELLADMTKATHAPIRFPG